MDVVCVSDLHGRLPEIPACDLLLIAGDVCPHLPGVGRVGGAADMEHQARWLDTAFRAWLDAVPARQVVGTWGNHDFVAERRPELIPTSLRWSVLVDAGTEVEGLRIWGSPWQPWFHDWAFNAPRGPAGETYLAGKYAAIPDGTDILISHGPPRGFGDLTEDLHRTGAQALTDWIASKRPRLVVTGHIHEARGQYAHPAGTRIINASVLDLRYRLLHDPVSLTL